ncbi:MAG: hypothetical protein ACE5H3_06675 [Planctomycetota bacterium]
MFATPLLLLFPLPAFQEAAKAPEPKGPVIVFQVDLIEPLEGDPIPNGTLLVRDGVIEKMGQGLVVPKGAEVHDLRGPGSSLLPPLVLAHGDFLQRDSRGRGRYGRFRASDSLYLDEEDLPRLRKQGILLVGIDPPGTGIPGRTSVYTVEGAAPRPDALVGDLYLKMTLQRNASSKKLLRSVIKDAEKAIEKEKKAREEWEKARKEWEEKQKARAEKEKKEKKEDQAGDKGGEKGKDPRSAEGEDGGKEEGKKEKEEKAPPEKFVPPKIDPDLLPVVEWLRKERVVQIWLNGAATWLHWKDLLGDRDLPFETVLSFSRFSNSHDYEEVLEKMAKASLWIYVPSRLTFLPQTRNRINLPADLVAAGGSLILEPPYPDWKGVEAWRQGVADLVRAGLDRTAALKAMTLEPAAALGQEEILQALKPGAPATFMVLGGDPLDPTAKVDFLVREGRILFDREKTERKEQER